LVYIGGIRVATLSGCMLVGTLVSFTHYKTSAIELSPFIELMVIIWALFTGIFIAGFAHYRETLSRNTILSQVQKQKEMQAKIQGIVKENSLFWSNISHELRNNITILFSFSELLDLEKPQGKQKRYLEHMLHTCTHVQSLLDQTMLLAQVNSGTLILQKKYFSLNALLLSLQQKFFVQAKEKKINFILDINIKHDSIYADEHRFHQVLTNLLSNAIKFTHSGSVSLSVQEQEDEVIFSVIDTGIGIPTEDQDSIFEPYHRINKRATNGMGLGLSIVKNILESMNTELIICSSPQEGTKCTFSFMIHVD
jgi:signal transduction histidine kinase